MMRVLSSDLSIRFLGGFAFGAVLTLSRLVERFGALLV